MRRVTRASKSKIVHIVHIRHRDEVEPPVTGWIEEAYQLSDRLAGGGGANRAAKKATHKRKKTRR